MDSLRVRVCVKPFGARSGYEAEFAIDAIRMDAIAPAAMLASAGIQPAGTTIFEYADRSEKELPFAFAQFEIVGKSAAGRVIFGPQDTEPTIGRLLFESAGLKINPDTQEIEQRVLRL